MAIRLGDDAPNFTAETTEGTVTLYDYLGDGWGLLFSHPKDFTPVCTTELGTVARLKPEFDRRGVKVVGLSIDPVGDHARWARDIEETQGATVNFPMIGDPDLKVAKLYNMLPAAASGDASKRTAADNMTVRNVFVIGPDKKVKLILVYPMSAGRNFDEILRVIDALQLNATQNLATPADWRPGQAAIIPTSVKDEDAKKLFPQGFKTLKPYLRLVQPKS